MLEIKGASFYFYNRVEEIPVDMSNPGGEKVNHTLRDFINFGQGNVLRGIQITDDLLVITLNDGHEEKIEIPVVKKNGAVEYQTERKFIQTRIPIEGLDQVTKFYAEFDKG